MAHRNNVPDLVSLTRLLARHLHDISIDEIPKQVTDKASLTLIDYIGAIGSGLQAPWTPNVISFAKFRKGVPQAHAWGLEEDIPAEAAAFVNSTLAHSAIRDDMHLKSNSHIGGLAISAALALAQRDHWTYDQLLRGIIGGYEAAGILGTAIQQSEGYNRHFRPSGLIGAFGAAATAIAAGKIKDEDTATNALSFAANMASGFNQWAWTGGMEIYTEMGTASQSGVVALDLAASGMKCSEDVLEGRAGCFAALGILGKAEELFKTCLNSPNLQIMEIRFKPAAGCNYAQTPTATALMLARKYETKKVTGVKVGCTIGAKSYPGCDNPGPFETIQQTKMSIQFGVCAALVHGNVSEEVFKKFDDSEINNMAMACSVEHVPEYDQDFKEGRQPAKIEIQYGDGTTVTEELDDVPWLDAEAVRTRFTMETRSMMSQTNAGKILSLVSTGDIGSCSELIQLLKGTRI